MTWISRFIFSLLQGMLTDGRLSARLSFKDQSRNRQKKALEQRDGLNQLRNLPSVLKTVV